MALAELSLAKNLIDLLKSTLELISKFGAKSPDAVETIAKPIFEECQNVFYDYTSIMLSSLEALGQTVRTKEGDAKALITLRAQRHRLLADRIVVREQVAAIIQAAHYRQFNNFLTHVQGLFDAANPLMAPVPISPGANALRLFEGVASEAVDRDDAIETVKLALAKLEQCFEGIAKSYARLIVDQSHRRHRALRLSWSHQTHEKLGN